jgi:hypothetical protein
LNIHLALSNRDQSQFVSAIHHNQLQLEAARIVTGISIFASSILIYKELGWESLAKRKLIEFIRIPYPTIIPYFTSIFKYWSDID